MKSTPPVQLRLPAGSEPAPGYVGGAHRNNEPARDWVLDADIRKFFDSIEHESLRELAYRIADPRIVRLIRKWLEADILESHQWHERDRGTPQAAGISPLLANIFLHYALDLWVLQWRRRRARGRVSIIRYADDFVMGFENAGDARRMMGDLKERLAKFGLSMHEDKTRLIAFGRLPAMARQQRGERRPETFVFLGFTHYCGWTRDGRFGDEEGSPAAMGSLQSNARTLPSATTSDYSPLGGTNGMTQVTLGKSRVRESCMPGSVRAKAEWLSYSTVTRNCGHSGFSHNRFSLNLAGVGCAHRYLHDATEMPQFDGTACKLSP